MSTFKTWVSAMRLRTLPLAASGIILGMALADLHYSVVPAIGILCLTTAIFLQVLSNFANDYGDFVKGTDNDNRIGNMRALQSGNINITQMRAAILLFVVLSLTSGIMLLYFAADGHLNRSFLVFFALGIIAVIAAIKYTVGKNAYGYSGLGDIAVFIFFGPVAVIGTFLLCSHMAFEWANDGIILLPAIAIGLLSTGVLNTNNIRDIENDQASGKFTIPVRVGLKKARIYHTILICGALTSFLIYLFSHHFHWINLFQIPACFIIVKTLLGVLKNPPSSLYNTFLKQLSLGTLLLVIVFVITNMTVKALAVKAFIDVIK